MAGVGPTIRAASDYTDDEIRDMPIEALDALIAAEVNKMPTETVEPTRSAIFNPEEVVDVSAGMRIPNLEKGGPPDWGWGGNTIRESMARSWDEGGLMSLWPSNKEDQGKELNPFTAGTADMSRWNPLNTNEGALTPSIMGFAPKALAAGASVIPQLAGPRTAIAAAPLLARGGISLLENIAGAGIYEAIRAALGRAEGTPVGVGSLGQVAGEIGTQGAMGAGIGSLFSSGVKQAGGWLADKLGLLTNPASKDAMQDNLYLAFARGGLNEEDARIAAQTVKGLRARGEPVDEAIQSGVYRNPYTGTTPLNTDQRWSPFRKLKEFFDTPNPEGKNVIDVLQQDVEEVLTSNAQNTIKFRELSQAKELLEEIGPGKLGANREVLIKFLDEERRALYYDALRKQGLDEVAATTQMNEYMYAKGVVEGATHKMAPSQAGAQKVAEAMIENRQMEHDMLTAATNKAFKIPSQASGEYFDWADALDPENLKLLEQIRANPMEFLKKTRFGQNQQGSIDTEMARRFAAQYKLNEGMIRTYQNKTLPSEFLTGATSGLDNPANAKQYVDAIEAGIDDIELTPMELFKRRQEYDAYYQKGDLTGASMAKNVFGDTARRLLREQMPPEYGELMDLWSGANRIARTPAYGGGQTGLQHLASQEVSQPDSWKGPRFFMTSKGTGTMSFNPLNFLVPELSTPQARLLTASGFDSTSRRLGRTFSQGIMPAMNEVGNFAAHGGGGNFMEATRGSFDMAPLAAPVGPAITQGESAYPTPVPRQGFQVTRNLNDIDPYGVAALFMNPEVIPPQMQAPLLAQWEDTVATGDKKKMAAFLGEISAQYPKVPFSQPQITGLPSEFDIGDGIPRLLNPQDQLAWEQQVGNSNLREDEKALRVAALRKSGMVFPMDMRVNTTLNVTDESQAPNIAHLFKTYDFSKRQQTPTGSRRAF